MVVEDKWLVLVYEYKEEFGHWPSWADLLLLQEAEASTRMER
jgi:hypothetical protein